MAIYIGNDIPPLVVSTIRQNVEQVAATDQQINEQQQGNDPLPLMEEDQVFPEPEKPKSGFNPLWLILAGAALGAIALSAARQK
jgi:hypothetical protein